MTDPLHLPCPTCSGTGTNTYEDRHTATRMDTCRTCGGKGEIAPRTGESAEASFSADRAADEPRLSFSGAPMPPDEIESCAACGIAFKLGDMVMEDINEGRMHRGCCGSERGSYTGEDGVVPQPVQQQGKAPAVTGGTEGLLEAAKAMVHKLIVEFGWLEHQHELRQLSQAVARAEAALARPDHKGQAAAGVGDAYAIRRAFDFLDGLVKNGAPGERKGLNTILTARNAKLAVAAFRAALPPQTPEAAIPSGSVGEETEHVRDLELQEAADGVWGWGLAQGRAKERLAKRAATQPPAPKTPGADAAGVERIARILAPASWDQMDYLVGCGERNTGADRLQQIYQQAYQHGARSAHDMRKWCLEVDESYLGYSLHSSLKFAHKVVEALTAPQAARHGEGERVRHVKRGTEYEVLGEAEAQVSDAESDRFGNWIGLYEGDKLIVYRDLATGKLWCRSPKEFRDGRFRTLTTPDKAETGEGRS